MLQMPSHHAVIITLTEKYFSAWLFEAHKALLDPRGWQGIQEQYHGSPSDGPALLCLARVGDEGQAAVTDCKCLRKLLRDVPLVQNYQECHGAAADTKNRSRANEPSKSCAFQKFWDTLLVPMKVLTSFTEGDGRIIFFEV